MSTEDKLADFLRIQGVVILEFSLFTYLKIKRKKVTVGLRHLTGLSVNLTFRLSP
jgi:hypothetical protein